MSYELAFHPEALKEWKKLPNDIKQQFKKILIRRQQEPHVPKAKLQGLLKHCYKIKLLKAGYRLVYQVLDQKLLITVIAVGKRENNFVYNLATSR